MDFKLFRQQAESFFGRLLEETLAKINASETRSLLIPVLLHKEGRYPSLTAKKALQDSRRLERHDSVSASMEFEFWKRGINHFIARLIDDEHVSENDLRMALAIITQCASRGKKAIREAVRARQLQALRESKRI